MRSTHRRSLEASSAVCSTFWRLKRKQSAPKRWEKRIDPMNHSFHIIIYMCSCISCGFWHFHAQPFNKAQQKKCISLFSCANLCVTEKLPKASRNFFLLSVFLLRLPRAFRSNHKNSLHEKEKSFVLHLFMVNQTRELLSDATLFLVA